MGKSIQILFVFLFLLALLTMCTILEAASETVQNEPVAIPGEYLVLFKARESISELEGRDRKIAVTIMLEMQGEYLTTKFGVIVKNTFSAISESSGKGMFFVRSDNAAKDPEFSKKLLEEMRSDPFIEGVSPNEVKKMISRPGIGTETP